MLTEIISTIGTSITGILGAIGSGAIDFFESIFLNPTGDGLSTLGVFLVFGLAMGMAIGVMRWIRSKMPG